MEDSEDRWPLPKYNPGARKHLHALGVIAITFASFETGVDDLYAFHPRRQKLPEELINLYYFSLNEEKRIAAVREVFSAYEKDGSVKAAINNVLDYFQWCRHARNQLLHSEHYPALFGGDLDTLHLRKRIGKQSPKSGYMAFHLSRLRSIADQIRIGVVQCAEIHIYLRVRDVPADSLPVGLRIYKHEPLPQTLRIPRTLKLSSLPHTPPAPAYLARRSSRR